MLMYKQCCFKVLAIAEGDADIEFQYNIVAEDISTAIDMAISHHSEMDDFPVITITNITKLVDVYV